MQHGQRATETFEVGRCPTAKSSIKILVHCFGSFRIPVHSFGSFQIPVHSSGSFRIALSPTQFLRIHSTMIFLRILISTYTLDNDIPSYPSQLNFYVYTRQWYSLVSWPLNFYVYTRQWHSFLYQFLRIHSTMIFLRIPQSNQFLRIHSTTIFLRIIDRLTFTYLLDNNNPSYPRQLNFYVYTRQWYSFIS